MEKEWGKEEITGVKEDNKKETKLEERSGKEGKTRESRGEIVHENKKTGGNFTLQPNQLISGLQ